MFWLIVFAQIPIVKVDVDGDGISDCRDSVGNICEPSINESGLAEECLSVGSFDFAHIFTVEDQRVPSPFDEFDMDEDGYVQCTDFNSSIYRQNGGSFSVIGGEDCNDDPYDNGSNIGQPQFWYEDKDSDTQGNKFDESPLRSCDQPDSYVLNFTDCDDESDLVFENADEICDGLDNDCDDEIDEGSVGGLQTFYIDNDGDGFGSPDFSLETCTIEEGYSWNDNDPDDSNDHFVLYN